MLGAVRQRARRTHRGPGACADPGGGRARPGGAGRRAAGGAQAATWSLGTKLSASYDASHVALLEVALTSDLLLLVYAPDDSTGKTIAALIQRKCVDAGSFTPCVVRQSAPSYALACRNPPPW